MRFSHILFYVKNDNFTVNENEIMQIYEKCLVHIKVSKIYSVNLSLDLIKVVNMLHD